ncbi:MAG: choice-of-anchor V domain-containing protein [Candidatus Brocadiales bacterium]|nr:choice-of-anchor V domain-containing protein [Candidatus Brocadiales bacterium]
MRILKKSIICVALNAALYGLLTNTVLAWSSGPPAYRTGATGDKGTCNADGCHNSYNLNSGGASFSITAPTTYTAGKAVKIKVAFSNFSGKKHGFEMTALDANGNRVGTFKKIGNTTQVISPSDLARELDKADKNKYIEHSIKGVKKSSWIISWTPSSGATDPITFYAAGCDADGNSLADKDYVYTATAEINASKP